MVLTELLAIKIAVTMIAVIALSLLAEHVSARMAGILAGFPHGIAIVLYFIGIEQGIEYAAQASIYAIGGLAANVLLVYTYYKLCRSQQWLNILLTISGSSIVFLLAAYLLRMFDTGQSSAIVISVGAIMLVAFLLRHTPNLQVTAPVNISYIDLVFRALLSTLIVIMVTEAAYFIGPGWAGLLSGFPIVTFPLLIIIHKHHGRVPVSTLVRNYPFGLVSLVIYTACVSFMYPVVGLNLGTLAGFLAASAYLAGASFVIGRLA